MNDNYLNTHKNILSRTNTNKQRFNSGTYISQEANTNDATNPLSNNINLSHDKHLQTNTFRNGLIFDNELAREINLNNIPQSLDNQFEREFTCNVPKNTSRQDPIQENNLKIDIYLCKDNKLQKKYNEKNINNMNYLQQTVF